MSWAYGTVVVYLQRKQRMEKNGKNGTWNNTGEQIKMELKTAFKEFTGIMELFLAMCIAELLGYLHILDDEEEEE